MVLILKWIMAAIFGPIMGDYGYWARSTYNATGIYAPSNTYYPEIAAGIYDPTNTSNILQNYGNKDRKFLETFDTTEFTVENTKGMALMETKGWYGAKYSGLDSTNNLTSRLSFTKGSYSTRGTYGLVPITESSSGYARPVIWN